MENHTTILPHNIVTNKTLHKCSPVG